MSGGAGFLNHQQYHPIQLNPHVLLKLFQKFWVLSKVYRS